MDRTKEGEGEGRLRRWMTEVGSKGNDSPGEGRERVRGLRWLLEGGGSVGSP